MGLFDFFTPENGPCNECEHKNGSECRKFYAQKHYSRVDGTSYTYHSCEVARSSSGFCGHKGKYWERRIPQREFSRSDGDWDGSFPGDSGPDV